jgi:transcriptional regulator with XRE-family HTH domain
MQTSAPPKTHHVLAHVRQSIDLTQSELGTLIGASTSTIQAIELGKLPLSEDLALRLNEAIGVRAQWLLANDLDGPLPSPSELREQFVSAQAGEFAGKRLAHRAPTMALVRSFVLLNDIASELGPEGCWVSGFYGELRKMTAKAAECIGDKRLRSRVMKMPQGHLSGNDKAIRAKARALLDDLDQALQDVPRRAGN